MSAQDKKGQLTYASLRRKLKALSSPERAAGAARYFKTGPGQYGEGDVFLGVTTPLLRRIVRDYRTLDLSEVECALQATENEIRAAALLIMAAQYGSGDEGLRRQILSLYLANTRYINNWNLVDCSCREIVGAHVCNRSTKLLTTLAKSESLWERRIAIVSTMALVKQGNTAEALRIAKILLSDKHDLIHKAVGWTLRVVGDADRAALLGFLQRNYRRIPRTVLRYAIEHFPPAQRKQMLAGKIPV